MLGGLAALGTIIANDASDFRERFRYERAIDAAPKRLSLKRGKFPRLQIEERGSMEYAPAFLKSGADRRSQGVIESRSQVNRK